MLYFIGWSLFLALFKFYLGFQVFGRENVPKKGSFIFASNHASYLDPMILGTSLYRSLNYMARESLFDSSGFARIMRGLHAFPVRPNDSDFAAIRTALGILNGGKPLVIFPEGTRSEDRALRRGMQGIGFLAAKSGVPVVPAYIDGSFEALPKGAKRLVRHRIKVYIGSPIYFDSGESGKKGRKLYQDISDRVMLEISKLKEKSY
jgi:1-acyl-sn-glycerol-3-phosphate acyltransferase